MTFQGVLQNQIQIDFDNENDDFCDENSNTFDDFCDENRNTFDDFGDEHDQKQVITIALQ